MRMFFDITHPANVHFFKYLIWQFQKEGHKVLVTARDKDVVVDLLRGFEIDHVCISRKSPGFLAMVWELIERNWRLLHVARAFHPDIMIAAEAGISAGPIAAMLGVPCVVFDQVDLAHFQHALGMPFATVICTGNSYLRDYGTRHIRFRGCLAQSYLDSRHFQPDPFRLKQAGLDLDKPYIVLRLVRWSASHDIGRKGLTESELDQIIDRLSPYGRVLITSEKSLPERFEEYGMPISPIHLHDLLAFAAICIAEGGTVAVEAGLLGTPAICCNTYDFGYLHFLEKEYGIIRRADGLKEAINIAETILCNPSARNDWQQRSRRLFEDTEDVLAFMRRVIESIAGECNKRQGTTRTRELRDGCVCFRSAGK